MPIKEKSNILIIGNLNSCEVMKKELLAQNKDHHISYQLETDISYDYVIAFKEYTEEELSYLCQRIDSYSENTFRQIVSKCALFDDCIIIDFKSNASVFWYKPMGYPMQIECSIWKYESDENATGVAYSGKSTDTILDVKQYIQNTLHFEVSELLNSKGRILTNDTQLGECGLSETKIIFNTRAYIFLQNYLAEMKDERVMATNNRMNRIDEIIRERRRAEEEGLEMCRQQYQDNMTPDVGYGRGVQKRNGRFYYDCQKK